MPDYTESFEVKPVNLKGHRTVVGKRVDAVSLRPPCAPRATPVAAVPSRASSADARLVRRRYRYLTPGLGSSRKHSGSMHQASHAAFPELSTVPPLSGARIRVWFYYEPRHARLRAVALGYTVSAVTDSIPGSAKTERAPGPTTIPTGASA